MVRAWTLSEKGISENVSWYCSDHSGIPKVPLGYASQKGSTTKRRGLKSHIGRPLKESNIDDTLAA